MTQMSRTRFPEVTSAYRWFLANSKSVRSEKDFLCATRSEFEGRLQTFIRNSKAGPNLYAVVGEIGNNCFDHNLGHWTDETGCYFVKIVNDGIATVVISDRGQGLFRSLKRVVPDLATPQQAIDIAFHRRITGRAPERRGNGLKLVRETVNAIEGRGLFYQTNGSTHVFGSRGTEAAALLAPILPTKGPDGTFALLLWALP